MGQIHADPHPGNFLINSKGQLIVLDFGCTKKIPKDFYNSYYELVYQNAIEDDEQLKKLFFELEIYLEKDSKKEQKLIKDVFKELLTLVARPIHSKTFDFGDDAYFKKIFETGESFSKDPKLKKLSARGSRHFIYFNRTYFGLYNILNEMRANITTSLDLVQKEF